MEMDRDKLRYSESPQIVLALVGADEEEMHPIIMVRLNKEDRWTMLEGERLEIFATSILQRLAEGEMIGKVNNLLKAADMPTEQRLNLVQMLGNVMPGEEDNIL